MRVESIEIHTGDADFPYTPVRQLEAKCEATTAFSPTPTIEDANAKLRQMAATVGANAVVNVQYSSGVSMTSWKSMKATGLAVQRESEEMPCPVCAETIKRAAAKCRFCGADLAATGGQQVIQRTGSRTQSSATPQRSAASLQEPLKSNDNPWWVPVIIAVVALLVFLITMLQ
jgi:hypothetical protein